MTWRHWMSVFAILLWIQGEITCEKDHTNCIFYYWLVDWKTAVKTCEKENTTLLCYKSKKEIDDITEAFRLSAIGSAKLAIWLSDRNCSTEESLEQCLSLHIRKQGDTVWHYFQNTCEDSYPFVCCVNGTADTTTSTEYIASFSNWTSETFGITDKSLVTTPHTASSIGPPFCPTVIQRGIRWPDTDAGKVAVRSCPGNSTGKASWLCENGRTIRWKKGGPDLSKCRSREIQDLMERFNSTSATKMIAELEDMFEDTKMQVFGEDMADILDMMTALPDRLFQELEYLTSSEKWTTANSSIHKVTSVVDRFVELERTWLDVEEAEKSVMGTNLLSTVDAMGSLLADSMPEEVNEGTVLRRNVALQVVRPKPGESVTLPQWIVTDGHSHRGRVTLEEGYDTQLTKDKGNISLVFALYNNMTNILSPTQDKNNGLGILNSAIVSATVSKGREAVSINSKVRIQMEHSIESPNQTACVFWNMGRDQWDTTGCQLEDSNETYSVCVCNHLTNFALLMDFRDIISETNQDPFHYITLIGCSLSIICLTICVVIFSCYSYHSRHSWGLRYVIHRNLCLTLLIANLVLIVGLDSTENKRVCAVVAGLLHYFFLSAFSWMFLEAVHIYLLLVIVFASRKSHSEKYYLFGYGFPFIVVTITALSRPSYYGREDVCWLSSEKGTIWAFMGPVAGILILNIAALLLAQYKASKISVKNDTAALVKRWLRVTLILFPVLGVTWVFGFLYLGKHFEVAGYLFAIFNSFQGVCIFVFHCLLDKRARSMIVNSISKRTITMHTGDSSGTQKKNSNGQAQNGVKSNSITPLENEDLNTQNAFQLPNIKCKKDWSKYRKPWSFCFEMPVSQGNTRKEQEDRPQAVMVHWNTLNDKN